MKHLRFKGEVVMNSEYSEEISEVLEILQYLEDDVLNKIPLDVIKGLKKYSSRTYTYKFMNKKGVIQDEVSEKAKDFFAVLYRRYIANEEEKIEFDKMLYENDLKESSKMFIKPLFEKKEIIVSQDELLPVIPKKGFMQKILDKIFKKRK